MGTRIHLYALPGLPLHVEDLLPQALLARCSGGLLAQGHTVHVADGGTLRHLDLPETQAVAALLCEAHSEAAAFRHRWRSGIPGRFRDLSRAFERLRAVRVNRILEEDGGGCPALAVIQIQRRKDVLDAQHLAFALKVRDTRVCVVVAGDWVNRYASMLLAGISEFDAACVGPAESVLAGLARTLRDRDSWPRIPGLIRLRGTAPPHLALPPPPDFAPANYHPSIYPALLEPGKIRLFTLPQSTGLLHAGHYRGAWGQRAVHVRDSRQLRAELIHLHELFGAQSFHVSGSDTPPEAIHQFALECRSLPFDIAYSRDAHVSTLPADILPALAPSGCRALGFTLLTGSQRLLSDYFGECWTISQVESCFRQCRAQGHYLHAEFVFPSPADDYHSRAETFRLLRRCQPHGTRIAVPELVPGSAWYDHAREFEFCVAPGRLSQWISSPAYAAGPIHEAAQLPYLVKGQRGRALAARVQEALRELEEIHVPRVSCVIAGLMARVSGYEGRERQFTQPLEEALLNLDLERLHDTIEAFNARATAPINTVDVHPPIRKAVGD